MQNNKHGSDVVSHNLICKQVCADTRYEITLTASAAGPFAIEIAVKLK